MFGKFYLILKELVYFHFQNIISLLHIRHYLWREIQFKLRILPSLYIKILAKYFDCSNSASWKTTWIWLIINSCTFFVFRDFLSEKNIVINLPPLWQIDFMVLSIIFPSLSQSICICFSFEYVSQAFSASLLNLFFNIEILLQLGYPQF